MINQKRTFYERKRIQISEIMYIIRENRKSVLHLANGDIFETFIPLKTLIETAPKNTFYLVNKGTALSPLYITKINKNIYTMSDGTTFLGRVHSNKNNNISLSELSTDYFWDKFNILDKLPMPFCVIELVFDSNGRGIDFIFKYCNKAMERLENKTLDQMINMSFYEVFENGDKKWLVTYADVALNGTSRIIESYSPEIGRNLKIYCFQPKQNFCACALIEV